MAINSSHHSDLVDAQINGWLSAKLGDMCDVRDGTHESPKFFDRGVPLVTSKNIKDGFVDLTDVKFISGKDASEINKRSSVNKNDILMSMIGSIGEVALVTEEPEFCIKNVALIKQGRLNQDYLKHWLQGPIFQASLKETLDGGIQKFISLGKLRDFEILFPETGLEQQAIAEVLSDADALIASLEKLIEKKQQLQVAVSHKLFSLANYSWTSSKLADVCVVYSGGTPSTANKEYYNGNIPFITSTDLNQNYIIGCSKNISSEAISNSAAKVVPKDSLLYALYGATAGQSAITRITGAINQAVLCIEPKSINQKFLYHWLKFHKDEIIERYCQGGQPNLSGAIVQSFEIPIPSKEEQTKIENVLDCVQSEMMELRIKLHKAKNVKAGMMQELLTGRTRLI